MCDAWSWMAREEWVNNSRSRAHGGHTANFGERKRKTRYLPNVQRIVRSQCRIYQMDQPAMGDFHRIATRQAGQWGEERRPIGWAEHPWRR